MISDFIRPVLPELQQQAESMMTTPCLIVRQGEQVTDPDTGDVTRTEETVFDGFCKIQTREGEARDSLTGSSTVVVQRYEVQVPVSAGPFRKFDLVRVNGREFRVEGLHSKTWQTAQRLPVMEEL